MSHIPSPIFQNKVSSIQWQKIYSREYGVQYSYMATLCISPKAKHIVPFPSVDNVIVPERNNTAFYVHKKTWSRLVRSLENKHTINIQALNNYEDGLISKGKYYVNLTKKMVCTNLQGKNNKELYDMYLEYQSALFHYSIYVWTAFILNNSVADRSVSIIDKYLKAHDMLHKKQEVLDSLFSPEKRVSALQLKYEVEKASKKMSLKKRRKLYERYKWLSCQDLHDSPWTTEQFQEVIKGFTSRPKPRPFSKYARLLGIDTSDLDYLMMAKRFVYIKDARDEFRRFGIMTVLPFFAEIARRMNIDAPDISYLLPFEITDFLKNEKLPSNQTVHKRKKGYVMYLDSNYNVVCLCGSKVQEALARFNLDKKHLTTKVIKGTIASKGTAQGSVVIVRRVKDLPKVKKGCILVAVATHPDYTIAMRKAVAIVTDEGGITSHAAIVSREYGVPCIVGTKIATKILNDGDQVLVDTEHEIVKKINT